MTVEHTDGDGVRFGGFKIAKLTSTKGKGDKPGKIVITLEAEKSEVSFGPYNLTTFLSAVEIHQDSDTPAVLRLHAEAEDAEEK